VEGELVHVRLVGEIDLDNAGAVQLEINSAIANHVSAVLLDLTGISYLDSAGLRILFRLAGRLRTLQMRLDVLAPLDSPVRRVLELSGFPQIVDHSAGSGPT